MKKSLLSLLLKISIPLYLTTITALASPQNSITIGFENKLSSIENKLSYANDKEAFRLINTQIKDALFLLKKAPITLEAKYILQVKFDISLAYSYNQLSNSDSSFYYFNEINRIIIQYPKINILEPLYVAYHWNNLGHEYKYHYANYSKAVSCYLEGLRICENISDRVKYKTAKIILANNLANVYDVMGKNDDAFNLYQDILQIGIKGIDIEYKIYTAIGWNYIRLKKYENALQYFKKSATIYLKSKKNKTLEEEKLSFFDIGMCYSYNANYLESNKNLDLLIGFYQKENIDKNKYLSLSLLQKAQNAYAVQDYKKGLQYVQQALKAIVVEFNEDNLNQNPTLSQTILDYQSLFHILTFKAKLFEELYKNTPSNTNLNQIFNCYHLAVKLSNEYRKEIDSPEDKLRLNQNNNQVFRNAILYAYKWFQSDPNTSRANVVLGIIESTKALALSDKIITEKIIIPPSALHIQYEIQNELSTNAILRQKIADRRFIKDEYDSLKSQLHKSEIKLSQLKNKLNTIVPIYNSKTINYDVTINEIIANISPESVYLSYSVTSDNQVYVLAINHQRVMFKKLEHNPDFFSNTVHNLIASLKKNPTVFQYQGAVMSEQMYDYLIKPIEPMLINKKRLLISRDGILNYLPFEVLENGKSKRDYLFKHFAISYQYTALSYILRQKKETDTPNNFLTVAPFVVNQKTPDGQNLNALETIPKSRDEVFLYDQNATKINFIKKISNYNVLNLECHSVADPQVYDQSFVLFNPIKKDWKLGFHEILTLNLSECKLLILASCNSAFGRNEAYESVLSLAYAFYKAGSHSVISAQWTAHDRSSAFITTRFYYYINQGIDKDYALQKAKIDFLNSKLGNELNHPFFWANLTLTGNTSAIKSPTHSYIYFIILIPILYILMMYLYKKIRTEKPLF